MFIMINTTIMFFIMVFVSSLQASSKSINSNTCQCIKDILKIKSCSSFDKYTNKKDILRINDAHAFTKGTLLNVGYHYLADENYSIYDVVDARNAITKLYICSGYINSGALLESYDEDSKKIVFKIIKGVLDIDQFNLKINQNKSKKYISKKFIKNNLNKNPTSAFNSIELRENLEFFRRKSQISSVQATITPSTELGVANLDLNITESPRHSSYVTVNNYNNPSIGSKNIEISGHYNSLLITDSYLHYSLKFSNGSLDYSLGYTWNSLKPNINWNIEAGRVTSTIKEPEFKSLDIKGNLKYFIASSKYRYQQNYTINKKPELQHNKSISSEISFINGVKFTENKNTLLGRPFSFNIGEINGKSIISNIFTGVEWKEQSRDLAQHIYIGIEQGIDAFGSTISTNKDISDSKYTTFIFQYDLQKNLTDFLNSTINLSINGQYTKDDLLSNKKLAMGGFYTIRGYRQNFATVDKGIITSLNLEIPISYNPIFTKDLKPNDGKLSIIPFIDIGHGDNNSCSQSK